MIDKWHREGTYVPYPEDELFELILAVKAKMHPWIRLNRVIRDIPNQYITGGCSVTNMRQVWRRMRRNSIGWDAEVVRRLIRGKVLYYILVLLCTRNRFERGFGG